MRARCRAFDETLMQAEFAVFADRDDAAGTGAVLAAVDSEIINRLVDLGAAFVQPVGLQDEVLVPILLAGFFELAEPSFDARDLVRELRRDLGPLRPHMCILRGEAVFGLIYRLGPGPLRAQSGGLGFELLDRETPHERDVIHEAVLVAAEEIARNAAACGLIGLRADKAAEIGIERHRAFGEKALHRVRLDVGIVLELAPDGELRRA
jgi:hypothetical protein